MTPGQHVRVVVPLGSRNAPLPGVVHEHRMIDDGSERGMAPCHRVVYTDAKGKERSTWRFADEVLT